MKRRLVHALFVSLPTFAFVTTAWGQTAEPVGAPQDGGGRQDTVQEVVVTAQKREQAINDVGLTVQALTSEQLLARGVRDVADLSRAVPGFTFTPSPYATPVYTLRGVGLYDSGLASAPSVSVYVDEVPLAFPIMTKAAALDVERVEVLKGPQGTLFGQSSTGGAVNYIAAKPTRDPRAGADLAVDEFGQTDVAAFFSGPLADGLRGRVALRSVQGGAWQESTSRNDELGDANRIEGRLLLDWDVSERSRLALNVNGFRDRSDPLAPSLLRIEPLNPALLAPGFAASVPARGSRDADWPAGYPEQDNDFRQVALRGEHEISRSVDLVAIASYQKAKVDQDLPFSGTPLPYQNLDVFGEVESWNAEVRLSGDAGDLNWIAGVSYEHVEAEDTIRYDQRLVTNRQPIPGVPPYDTAATQLTSEGESLGVFGNLDYELAPALRVRAGLRYTRFESSGRGCSFDDSPGGELGRLFEVLQFAVKGSAIPIRPGDCASLDQAFNPAAADLRLDDENLSWRVGFDYDLPGGTLLYANYSRGYKQGIFPNVAASRVAQYEPARQERLDAYEVGLKAPLLERRLQLNASAFFYDYKDKQFRGTVLDPVFGKLERELNLPKSEVLGLELEATAQPLRGLSVSAGLIALDAEVTAPFQTFTSDGFELDAEGSPLPFTPELQIVGDVQYERDLTDGLLGFIGAGVTHNSETNASLRTAAVAAEDFRIDAFTLVDLRAGVAAEDSRWRLSAWVKNATDEYRWNTVFRVIDGYFRYNDRPRTFGVTLSVRTD